MTSGGNCFARVATAQLRRQDDGRMECDAMTRGVPVLDPRRDLKGATPETLARAPLWRVASCAGAMTHQLGALGGLLAAFSGGASTQRARSPVG